VRFQHDILDNVGRLDLALQAAADLQPRQQGEIRAIAFQQPAQGVAITLPGCSKQPQPGRLIAKLRGHCVDSNGNAAMVARKKEKMLLIAAQIAEQ
jgi:hypothetical protein